MYTFSERFHLDLENIQFAGTLDRNVADVLCQNFFLRSNKSHIVTIASLLEYTCTSVCIFDIKRACSLEFTIIYI